MVLYYTYPMSEIRTIDPTETKGDEPYISEKEHAIIDSLSEPEKELAQQLHKPNLSKYKDQIVGMRSEDLYYFLSCIKQGYIPTAPGHVRDREPSGRMFFLTPNPENAALKERVPEYPEGLEYTKFNEMAQHNNETYGYIGAAQGIYRDLMEAGLVEDPDAVAIEYMKIVDPSINFEDTGHVRESFWLGLANDFKTNKLIDFNPSNRGSVAIYCLGKHIAPESQNAALQIIQDVKKRQSIFIAFNDKILDYQLSSDSNDVNAPNELVAKVPDGKIPMDAVLGFETQGDYEDEIMERL